MILAALVRHWVIRRQGETLCRPERISSEYFVMGLLLMLLIISVTNARFITGSTDFILRMILLRPYLSPAPPHCRYHHRTGLPLILRRSHCPDHQGDDKEYRHRHGVGHDSLQRYGGPFHRHCGTTGATSRYALLPECPDPVSQAAYKIIKNGFKRSNHMETSLVGATTVNTAVTVISSNRNSGTRIWRDALRKA